MRSQHAHGYVVQVLADLGLIGLALSLLALVGWAVAASRSIGLRPRAWSSAFTTERAALVTLVAVVIVFGVHSAFDWTWFVPATALVGLLAAGWTAPRGPLAGTDRAAAGAPAVAGAGAGGEPPGRTPARPLRIGPVTTPPWLPRALAAVGVGIVALVAAYTIWQPLRAEDRAEEASELTAEGNLDEARGAALDARDIDPLAVEPLFELALVEDRAGRPEAAEQALADAVALQPGNPDTWIRLGTFRLKRAGQTRGAMEAFAAALYLDPKSAEANLGFVDARVARAGRPATVEEAQETARDGLEALGVAPARPKSAPGE